MKARTYGFFGFTTVAVGVGVVVGTGVLVAVAVGIGVAVGVLVAVGTGVLVGVGVGMSTVRMAVAVRSDVWPLAVTVTGPAGTNAVSVSGGGVVSGTQAVNLDTTVAALTVNTGTGNDSVVVSNLGNSVQSLAVSGGSQASAAQLAEVLTRVAARARRGGTPPSHGGES